MLITQVLRVDSTMLQVTIIRIRSNILGFVDLLCANYISYIIQMLQKGNLYNLFYPFGLSYDTFFGGWGELIMQG